MASHPISIRPADCDSFGHVNNAAYFAYLELALAAHLVAHGFAADWHPDGQHGWQPREVTIEYRAAARLGDDLAISIWLLESDPSCPVLGGAVTRRPPGGDPPEALVRARISWQRVDRASGRPVVLPQDLLESLVGETGPQPAVARPPIEVPGAARYRWQHRVMRAELAAHGRAQPQAVYHWLEEAIFNGSADAGWPVDRWLAEGYFTLNIRHDTSIIELPRLWEEVETTSQIVDLRRLRGTWLVELRRPADGALLVRDYSTGVFLNLEGRPASPPVWMLEEIQFGRQG